MLTMLGHAVLHVGVRRVDDDLPRVLARRHVVADLAGRLPGKLVRRIQQSVTASGRTTDEVDRAAAAPVKLKRPRGAPQPRHPRAPGDGSPRRAAAPPFLEEVGDGVEGPSEL